MAPLSPRATRSEERRRHNMEPKIARLKLYVGHRRILQDHHAFLQGMHVPDADEDFKRTRSASIEKAESLMGWLDREIERIELDLGVK